MSDLVEWDRFMWAVLWDTRPDDEGRVRHLCRGVNAAGQWSDCPALFETRQQARAYIHKTFGWSLEPEQRRRPMNNRWPQPYRVRVRISVKKAAPDA